MRYEIKYVFPQYAYNDLIIQIMSRPLLFREIYYERQVNNVYFDTPELCDFRESANGIPNRSKTRVRWYGELKNINSPKLECKYKRGSVNGKIVKDYPDFAIIDIKKLTADNRCPTLVNTYKRRYFATPDGMLRVTVDRDLRYYGTTQAMINSEFGAKSQNVVLEIKFEREDMLESSERIQGFGWTVYKNSKYVNGINTVLYGMPPE